MVRADCMGKGRARGSLSEELLARKLVRKGGEQVRK